MTLDYAQSQRYRLPVQHRDLRVDGFAARACDATGLSMKQLHWIRASRDSAPTAFVVSAMLLPDRYFRAVLSTDVVATMGCAAQLVQHSAPLAMTLDSLPYQVICG